MVKKLHKVAKLPKEKLKHLCESIRQFIIRCLNKGVLIGCVISLLIIVSYGLTLHASPILFFKNMDIDKINFFYGKVVDLSIGFIVSAMFYLIVVFLPKRKEQEKVNKVIRRYLEKMVDTQTGMISRLNTNFYNNKEYDQLVLIDFISISYNIDWNKQTGYYESSTDVYTASNFIEYLSDQVIKVDYISSNIFGYPGSYDEDLFSLIDEIKNSRFHKRIREYSFFYKLIQNSKCPNKEESMKTLQLLGEDINEYYGLTKRLQHLDEKYKKHIDR